MKTTSLKIDGMSCGHCVGRVRAALQAVSGGEVQRVDVGTATVQYDPDATSPDAMVSAVAWAGYAATVEPSAAEPGPSSAGCCGSPSPK